MGELTLVLTATAETFSDVMPTLHALYAVVPAGWSSPAVFLEWKPGGYVIRLEAHRDLPREEATAA